MKALSVRQPDASLIAQGKKSIIVKPKYTYYRGPLLICSSAKPALKLSGSALAKAYLVECRAMSQNDCVLSRCLYKPGQYVWILDQIEPIKPFLVKGKGGLFEVEHRIEVLE